MRVSHWLVLGLLLGSAACVPDRAPTSQGRAPSAPAPAPGAAGTAALSARDYGQVDRHALAAPASAERSLDALAAWLGAPPARDEADKARAIYRWITDRIAYDAGAYFSGRFRNTQRAPEDVLRQRLAVCDGYAGLFEALARRVGLQAVVVSGHGKGFGYHAGQALAGPADHAWNAVRLNGAWYLLDATWGAGTLDARSHAFQRRYEPLYFAMPPEQFVQRHLPEQPGWQLLPRPLGAEAFAALPLPWPAFFRDRLSLKSHSTGVIRTAGELTVRIGTPQAVGLTARLLRDGVEVAGRPTFVERDGAAVLIHVRPPRAGAYALQVLSKADPAGHVYESALEYRLVASAGVGGGQGFPEVLRPFADRAGRLEEPRRGRLPAGTAQRFRLTVPGASQVVAAVDGRMVELAPQAGAFAGEVRVPRGPFVIFARFPGEESYAGLLRFEGY
jgi:Transglutaminase-like superfamily